jgi:hypothetical protein
LKESLRTFRVGVSNKQEVEARTKYRKRIAAKRQQSTGFSGYLIDSTGSGKFRIKGRKDLARRREVESWRDSDRAVEEASCSSATD